jgi:hypothetical protein
MFIRAKHLVTGVAAIFLAFPVWAHTETTTVGISNPTAIAGTQLAPGEYEVKVQDAANQVSVIRDGKVVAEVPCHWIQLPKKADSSEIILTKNQITQIDFRGKTEAIQFAD